MRFPLRTIVEEKFGLKYMQIETGKEENEFDEDDDAEESLPTETNGSVSDLSLVEEMRLVPKDPSVCILQISIHSLMFLSLFC